MASPIDLRCSNFDVSQLRDISYQCGKELTCFFQNIVADNETQFVYPPDRYQLSYKCIGFFNSTVHQLPIDIFQHYPNAEILYAANLGLKTLSRALFENANRLVDVHLEGNNLTGLDEFLFHGAVNLRRIVLSNNQITTMGKDTFKKMIVKSLNAFDNPYQRKLEEIDLSNNQLMDLEYETFSQLNSLKILLLAHNNIKLKFGLFPVLLKKLDLSYNQLRDFTLRQLINSQMLEELKLNGNFFENASIEYIFPEAIFQLMHIYRFELSDCFTCMHLADIFSKQLEQKVDN
ncbi:CLUMA_CG010532, isoform A [Clunio marinus]|uniref:CLUMA_CG010532, isoform A n=1 Tax=Clunio marinus TaxID=568069 RepID=A0A1J1IA25_9DIPT|nr:CLUMA_CG010532, isoform A [Clunio marinus]